MMNDYEYIFMALINLCKSKGTKTLVLYSLIGKFSKKLRIEGYKPLFLFEGKVITGCISSFVSYYRDILLDSV